jgi:hypothetical protein
VSAPVSGSTPEPDPLKQADRITGSLDPDLSATIRNESAGVDRMVAVPVEVPVPVETQVSGEVAAPLALVVPAEATERWSGTVIDAVPTTVDDIAALVLAVPDVVRLHAGRFGEVATYVPGRRITGIKLGDDTVEVHVVVAGRAPIRDTAQLIHAAVATLVATPAQVYVEDLAVA